MTISLLSHTEHSYCEEIYRRFGRGRQQASILYSQWLRKGDIDRSHPSFKNCTSLIDKIIAESALALPLLATQREEGATGKFLLRTRDDLYIESVCIPMQAGGTLCVSSQVGCRLGCAFCETGRMGLLRNLSAEEIVAQVFVARHQLGFQMRNIVFMGMGEPFDNYEAVMEAVRILSDPKGMGFGPKHLTLSTSGVVPGIHRFMNELGETPHLAVSLTAAEEQLRNRLMPINRKYPLGELYQAMQRYNQVKGREILVAYVLLKNVNDTIDHADQLANFLSGLQVKVNVIPYNQQSNGRFSTPEDQAVDAFIQRVRERGFYTLRRTTKGQKIMAACGQLGHLELRRQRRIQVVDDIVENSSSLLSQG